MKPSSFGGFCFDFPRDGVVDPDEGSKGLYRSTHDVSTAFWFESNATLPYFYKGTIVESPTGEEPCCSD